MHPFYQEWKMAVELLAKTSKTSSLLFSVILQKIYKVGNSDYAQHGIQPWDIWLEYKLNPFDADILKRILRKKAESGMSLAESRIMDYKKIIHIANERIRQLESHIDAWNELVTPAQLNCKATVIPAKDSQFTIVTKSHVLGGQNS